MSSNYVHRITPRDPASSQRIASLLAELQGIVIRGKTANGSALSFVVSAWRQDPEGSFIVQFSPLAAERLPALAGIELLEAARGLALAQALLPDALAEPHPSPAAPAA
jgi:hypothetical protein